MAAADLTRLFLGPGPSGYGTDPVMGAILTAWDPVTYRNTVTDGAYTFTDCLVLHPSLLVTGRVALLMTAAGPLILGNTFRPVASSTTPDTSPPTAPAGLGATAVSGQVALTWTASADNVGVAGYRVLRDGSQIATTTTATTYTDSAVVAGATYAYMVTAVDAAGNVSPPSSTVTVTVPSGGGGPGAADLYVSPSGSDANPGTAASPKATPAGALAAASPGNVILLADGTYPGNLVSSRGGTAGNFITIRAATKWGATIVGNSNTSAESVVEFNHQYLRIQDVVVTGPGGEGSGARNGVELNADNTEIIGCHIHTICQWLTGGTGWQGGAGISVNGPTRVNVLADGNVIHDIGLRSSTQQLVHGAYCTAHVTNGRFVNNLIYECEDFGLHPYDDTENSGWQFVNNTVVACGRGILQAPNGVTRNNIVHNVSGRHYDIRGAGNVLSNNYYSGTGTGSTTSTGVASIGSPGFVNPATDGSGDFSLQAGSGLVDAGTATGAPAKDINGVTRPVGGGYDVGAYER